MPATVSLPSYWERFAPLYARLGSPLRPTAPDLAHFEAEFHRWSASHPGIAPIALMLGVTPPLAAIRWPASTRLLAADKSFPTIRGLWPGKTPNHLALCADWCELPIPPASVHLAAGDGSFNCLSHPEEAIRACAAIHTALHPEARLVLRCYIRPDHPESPEAIFEDLQAGRIPSVTHFKYRLFLALATRPDRAVPVDDIYRLCASHHPDWPAIETRNAWQPGDGAAIEAYRDSSTVHSFPTLAEFEALFSPLFHIRAAFTPSYPLGESCRLFTLEPRQDL